MHLTVRADGGPEIGYGHLVRSGALAEILLDRGHAVTYATTTPEYITDVCPDAVETVQLPSRDNPRPFTEWLNTANVDLVFTDAYPVNTDYQRAIRERVPLAVLQDDARHAVCADVFTNGNLYAEALDYDYVGDVPELCLGPSYALVRAEIRELAAQDPPWRDPPERAIVTMGGSDMTDQTPTALRAFDGFDLQVDAIVGPGFSETQEQTIRAVAEDVSADVRVSRDPDDLVKRMFQADFAVSTASSTTYELLALGTPIVSAPVADNQDPIATALRTRDAAAVLERGAGKSAFRRAIEEYVTDPSFRRKRRELGQNLVDGRGAERVANVMCDVVES